MTTKKLKKCLKNIYFSISQNTYTSIAYLKTISLPELIEWIDYLNEVQKKKR